MTPKLQHVLNGRRLGVTLIPLSFETLRAKICFRLRERISTVFVGSGRRLYWTAQGMKLGKGTVLPRCHVTWPHQVHIGDYCSLEHDIVFKFDGIYRPGPSIVIGSNCFLGSGCEFNIRNRIVIGRNCLVASGCRFIDGNHGTERGQPMRIQNGTDSPICLGDDVWLGAGVTVLRGVSIGTGSIVGAGAVVTKSIPAYTVFAGVPAVKLRDRQ